MVTFPDHAWRDSIVCLQASRYVQQFGLSLDDLGGVRNGFRCPEDSVSWICFGYMSVGFVGGPLLPRCCMFVDVDVLV